MVRGQVHLLLVYNAESGILNAIRDTVWKLVSPATYPCSLCAITYGAISMRYDWRRFLDSLPFKVLAYHKDEFVDRYPDSPIGLPAIAVISPQEQPRVLLSERDLAEIENIDELIERVKEALVAAHFSAPELRIFA